MENPPDEIVTLTSEIASRFHEEVSARFAGLGYTLKGEVTPRFFQRWNVLCVFESEQGGDSLAFLLAPTNPAEPAYKRSKRLDIVYFSEDVADEEQDLIYQRDRPMIDAFAEWVIGWDKPTSRPFGSP